MGKKYIIELEDNESVYKTVHETIIANKYPILQVIAPAPYTEPNLDALKKEAYDKGVDDGLERCRKVIMNLTENKAKELEDKFDEWYQQGLNDAWEAARKIILTPEDGGLSGDKINEIFHVAYYRDALRYCSASEAVEKIQAYEQKQKEIQVGDEIIRSNGEKYVVLIVDDEKNLVTILRHDGYKRTIESKWVTKTGRHYPEIAEVLQKMKENSDG